MKKLKIGVIGLGGIANFHMEGILASEDAEVWSICDCNEEALLTKGGELNVPPARRYVNHLDMLKDSELDAVTIGTPNSNHFVIALDAIKYRKPFALEKPIALDAKEAAVLREALEAGPLPHMVCFTYRYKSAVRFAKQLIEQGALGKINHVYSQYLQSWAIREDIPLVWRFRKELSGSGALGDLGSHILDLKRFLVGETVRVIADAGTVVKERDLLSGEGKGEVDVDDFCHVLAHFADGASSSMSISRFAYGRGNYQQVEIYGTRGALVYNLEEEDTIHVKLGEEQQFRKLEIPVSFKANQMQSFFDLLNGKGDGLDATIEDGYINQLTLDAIVQSFTEERWITIEQEASRND
ncbi:Gfo/Idh/MocA family oxidoreductase [Paenibacillus alkaliterrae]|uniref:Gfo/Idh/MocA family protein n=1 Tax=Paenibacillus alkaliterrae TaxID=320909 RepID=UPI001F3B3668|nr:Gfo/Idh/MocA family oxidoreductase [Paenibacillus alkaliterrae]MCF2939376.1 Gfo/Idh/MocA family oxidoreductase [Paenibacillus alkaliterrae]